MTAFRTSIVSGCLALAACSSSKPVRVFGDGGARPDTITPDVGDAVVEVAPDHVPDVLADVEDGGADADGATADDEEGGGGAEFLPDEGFGAGDAGDWRPPTAVVLYCPWLPQVPPGDWGHTKNCGPVSLLVAKGCMTGLIPSVDDVIALTEWMEDFLPGYSAGAPAYNGSYTTTEQLQFASTNFVGISASRVTRMTLQVLYTELLAGRPVIVGVDTQRGNNAPGRTMRGGDGHFMTLVGMTPTDVVLNDPGRSDPCNADHRHYSIESFWRIWSKHGRAAVTFQFDARNLQCDDGGPCTSCRTTCSDRRCVGGEDCTNCPRDCGACDCECADADGDGFLAGCDNPICGPQNDCDDTRADVHLGASENCDNRLDDDCDGAVDCTDADCLDQSPCGCASHADCPMGVCCDFARNQCSLGPIDRCGNCEAVAEACNGVDDDCDGVVDNGLTCPPDTFCRSGICRPDPPCTITQYGTHRYALCSTPRDWVFARNDCARYGWYLATINTSAENEYVLSIVSGEVWVGFSDTVLEGEWRWANDDPAIFQQWCLGEPNNEGDAEDCALLVESAFYCGDCRCWNDASCINARTYLCELNL